MKAQFEGISDGVLDLSIERIRKNIRELERFENLINDLEELTKLESPEMTLSLQEIEASEFLESIRRRFEDSAITRNIALIINIDTKGFRGDENLLHRAVSNIISNALRHTGRNGSILITLKEGDPDNNSVYNEKPVVLTVFNTGEPISADEAKVVFERLYRGEKARSSPGSGLGLTIAEKITTLHNGSIRIEGVAGKGTIVEMRLFHS